MKQQKTKASLQAELDNAQLRIEELERALHAMDPKRAAPSPAATTAEPDLLSLLNLLPVGVSVLDHNQQVVFQNAALSNILGLTEEELQEGEYRQRTYLRSDGTRMPADGFASVRTRQSGKAVYNVETGIVKENGETIWTSVSAVPLLSNHWKMAIFTLDITERKQAESQREAALSKVRESEERYNLLFEKSTIPAVLLKLPEVVIVDANEAAEKLTGYLRPEMRGRTAAELGLITHKQRAQAISQFEKRGELAGNEGRITTKSGEERIVVSRTNRLEIGGLPHAITTLEDVTERKQADAKRDRFAERLNLATHSARMGIWDWDIVKNEIVWDDQMYALYGLKPGEFGGAYEAWLRGVHPDDRDAGNELSTAAVRGEREYDTEFRVLWPDGSVHWLKANGQVFRDEQGMPLRMVGVNYDITERKRDEHELQKIQDHLNFVLKKSHTGGWNLSLVDHTAFRTLEHDRIFGYEALLPEWTFEMFIDHVVPEDRNEVKRLFQEAVKAQTDWSFECRIRRVDGGLRWIWAAGEHQYDVTGCATRMAGIVQDITERKHVQDRLRESEERLRIALANSPIVVFNQDQDLRYTWIYNPQLGFNQDAVLGKTDAELLPAEDAAHLTELKRRVLSSGETAREEVATTVGGQTFFHDLTVEPLRDSRGNTIGVTCVSVDITDRKLIENDLRRSNAELEQFAYVASHDLQEPLRAMTGMVQLLGNKYKGRLDENADEYIGHAVEAASRMQALINDLLAYSRVGSRGKPLEPVPASDCLQAALHNLLVSIGESGAIVTCDDLPTVHADATQLIQLFQNLVGNGIKFRGAREPRIHVSATHLKDSWRFSVRDNGIGIEPQYFERIFLVFQRLHTRREYAGTGIGLALCKKIVERHGGAIWVESQPGEGSTFYFTFPIRS